MLGLEMFDANSRELKRDSIGYALSDGLTTCRPSKAEPGRVRKSSGIQIMSRRSERQQYSGKYNILPIH